MLVNSLNILYLLVSVYFDWFQFKIVVLFKNKKTNSLFKCNLISNELVCLLKKETEISASFDKTAICDI